MIRYIAFLRGINFGGNKKIEMSKLREIFESLGFLDISTYMNSGNVVFLGENNTKEILSQKIETKILNTYGFEVKVMILTHQNLKSIYESIPGSWGKTKGMLPHIAFLWEEVDDLDRLELLGMDTKKDGVLYIPGAILWNVELKNWSKCTLYKFVNTKISQSATIRSINTVRKLVERIER